MLKQWFTEKEAAAHLRVSFDTLRRLRYAKSGPPFATIGSKVLYSPTLLDRWLSAKASGSGGAPEEERKAESTAA